MLQKQLAVYKIYVLIVTTVIWNLSFVCNGTAVSPDSIESNDILQQVKDEIYDDSLKELRMQDSRPNIVLIVADDMGWGDVGANWPHTVDTPNIDLLAKQGLRLTDFHTGASVCSPSRAALLTGRLGLRTGVVCNFGEAALGGIPQNESTLGDVMQEAGYRTGMLGKWHLGMKKGHHPLDKGFQSYLGVPYSVDMGCADPPGRNLPQCPACPHESSVYHCNTSYCFEDLALPLYRDREIVHQPAKITNLATMYADFAHSFIKDSSLGKSPYFLYAALTHVHVPLAHAPHFDNVTGRGVFADTLREMDWLVGRIAKAVKSGSGSNNTLIWFISDNGPWVVKCELAGSVGPFTGDWQRDAHGGGGGSAAKQTVWEAGHRVPSIVHWPLCVKAGTVSDALVSAMDIMPTLVAVTKASLPPHRDFDGQDIVPVITGASHQGHQVLFHPNSGAAGTSGEIGAVRIGPYKVVYYSGGSPDCSGHIGPARQHFDVPLVFHLGVDPAERMLLLPSSAEYRDATWRADQALCTLHASIKADNTSIVDYRSSKSARPCCDAKSDICRCPWD